MSLTGLEPLSADEVSDLDRAAQVQAEYLERFRQEIELNPPAEIAAPRPALFPSDVTTIIGPKPMSVPQAIARTEKYANSAHQAAQQVNRKRAKVAAGLAYERRVLGHPKTEHCSDCPPLAAKGWQPVGTLPDIGDSECGPLCLCHFEYTDEPGKASGAKTPVAIKPPRKILLKATPNTTYKKILRNPTPEEIDAEFKKWVAGKPSRIAVKDVDERPAEPAFVVPEGYTTLE